MESLLALGRAAAPLALDLTLKASIAAGASLLAVRVIGRRRPACCFALIAAALLGGAAAGLIRLPVRPFAIRVALPAIRSLPAPPLAIEARPSPHDVKAVSAGAPALNALAPAAAASRAHPTDWLGVFGLTWIAGVLLVGAYRLAGALALCRMMAGAVPCRDARLLTIAATARAQLGCQPAPCILLSPTAGTAYTTGIFRPAIVLPRDTPRWPDGRAVSALLHETMHVKRRDNLVAELLRVAAALAWFSPLPWLALGSAIRLREEACDEAVLGAGIAPASYATDLLEAARSVSLGRGVSTVATMASPGNLEQRIRAVLSWSRHAVRPFARLRAAVAGLLLAAAGCASLFGGAAGPDEDLARDQQAWSAVVSHAATVAGGSGARGSFLLTHAEGVARIHLDLQGRQIALAIPAQALPTVLPLGPRARLARPFGDFRDPKTQRAYFNPGWGIRDSQDRRSTPIVAAAAGTVVSSGAVGDDGPTVEIDHGFGLRTRYSFGTHGSSTVAAGTRVAAGDPVGSFGPSQSAGFGRPCDIPVLRFLVLAEIGKGELVALDPAPLVFNAPVNRNTPLAAAVVNAAIREGDEGEVDRLVSLSVGLNTVATDGTFPLEWTIMTQNVGMARTLVAAGANPAVRMGAYELTVSDLVWKTGNPELIAVVNSL